MIEKLSKAMEVYYLAFAQKFYYLVYIRIVAQAKNVVVGRPRLLLCCQ